MKKIAGLAIAIALVVALIGTGTWALFSDTETSTGNQMTAGIIDLEVDCAGDTTFSAMDDPLDKIFEYLPANDIKPGDDGEVTISLHLKTNSNDADLWMQVLNILNFGGLNPEPEQVAEASPATVDDDIASEIMVHLWFETDGDNVWESGETHLYGTDTTYATLAGLETAGTAGVLTVKDGAVASTTYYVGWEWELPSTVGNEHQGDYCTFDIVFGADQIVP